MFNTKKEKALEDIVAIALKQIEDKRYEEKLIANGVAREQIRKEETQVTTCDIEKI